MFYNISEQFRYITIWFGFWTLSWSQWNIQIVVRPLQWNVVIPDIFTDKIGLPSSLQEEFDGQGNLQKLFDVGVKYSPIESVSAAHIRRIDTTADEKCTSSAKQPPAQNYSSQFVFEWNILWRIHHFQQKKSSP